ncbi:MAG: carboxypeptidase regulatory-like domain-containing protein [Armatimonadetes bacterium]|nr:carboxypeptidase regulatory-like domain-containing protein [Armatimonadota bacterium]
MFRVLLLVLLASVPAVAQSSVLAGLVYSDTHTRPTASGKDPVEGARVVVRGTAFEATTDTLGMFHFENVRAGKYTLEVSRPGWKTAVATVTVDGSPLPATVQIRLIRRDVVAGSGLVYVAYQQRKGFELKPMRTVPGAVDGGADPLALESNPPRSPRAPVSLQDNPTTGDPDALMLLDAAAPEGSKVEPLQGHPFWLCFNRSGTALYVSTSSQKGRANALEIVDATTHKVLRRLPTAGLVTDLRLSPDGTLLLASVRGASPGVHLIDTAQQLPVGFLPLGVWQPGAAAMGADGLIYVASQNTAGSLLVLSRDGQLVAQARVGLQPTDLILSPDGSRVFVVNSGSGSISVFGRGLVPERVLPVGAQPQKLALSPDGQRLFVTNRSSDSVTVIDVPSLTVWTTVEVGDEPIDVAFSGDGSRAFVTCKGDGTVYFLDGSSGQPLHVTHPQPRSSPFGIAVRP